MSLEPRRNLLRVSLSLLAAALLAASTHTFAQSFEVASIRQNTSGGAQHYGPSADGYRVTNLPLLVLIVTAYPPQHGEAAIFTDKSVVNLPEWTMKESYDITAKVAESDLPAWQDPARRTAMMRAMLQRLLEERCKLAVHHDMKEAPVYLLVVGKNGPKLTASNPDAPHPAGLNLPGGGMILPENGGRTLHFYDASMATLAPILSTATARPVQDKTGLTGRYDFLIPLPDNGRPAAASEPSASEPGPSAFSAVEELGLKLVPAKAPSETLVIDHIERPSEN
jgi:uncharacterized protein (TIGR03435 family)